jgi:hypothetical protein
MPVLVMKGDDERETVIRFKCRNRDIARNEILMLANSGLVPAGHIIDLERIRSNRSDSNPRPGRRVEVTVVLFQNDSRELPADLGQLERSLKALDAL